MALPDRAYLEHVRAACREISRDMSQLAGGDLTGPSALRNSILYSLIIIGEAVNQLSPEMTARHPSIPWRKVTDLRNVLAHRYFEIDSQLLQQTIREHVPRLLREVEVMLTELPDDQA